MPRLNTNIFPYFNDFAAAAKYYAIFFRPKVPVQAREVNALQSIIQNQIESFGSHIFKEGAVVKDGEIKIDTDYKYIKVVATPGGQLDINATYRNSFVGKVIRGAANAEALIVNVLPPSGGTVVFYVKYRARGGTGGSAGTLGTFSNNELLTVLDENGDATLLSLTMASSNSVGIGSAANVKAGIYYIRGKFVIVDQQTIILDELTNEPSYRIGFLVEEDIIDSDDDQSLLDNAAGFPNHNAPGAHRHYINLTLTKLALGSQGTDDFIELLEVKNGGLTKDTVSVTQYSEIQKEAARRTYDESGDYTVTPFKLDVREFYNDDTNRGIYKPTDPEFQFGTADEAKAASISRFGVASPGTSHSVGSVFRPGSSADNLIELMRAKLAVGIDPGKAYVRGFEIKTTSREYIDLDKARAYESKNNATIKTRVGNYFRVDNVHALPDVKNLQQVTLYDTRTATRGASAGTAIGTCRVRHMEYENGTPGNVEAVYRLHVFDVKINPGKFLYNARMIQATDGTTGVDFSCDIIPEYVQWQGNITVAYNSTSVAGFQTIWSTGIGQELVAGDYIAARNKAGVLKHLKVATISSNTALTIAAAPGGGSSADDISAAPFYYTFTQIYDPHEAVLLFPLPQNFIRTVTSDGITVDTNYVVSRYFAPQTANGSGEIQISTAHADEEFLDFSAGDWTAVYTSGSNEGDVIALSSGDLTYNGTSTQVTIGNLTVGDDVAVIAAIRKTQGTPATAKTKSLTQNATVVVNSDGGLNEISLGKADIYKLKSVHMSSDFSTAATTGDKNITDWYELDDGQRDEFYDLGSIRKKPEFPKPTGRLLITFDYFTHGVNGNYFSVDTYSVIAGLEYENIPTYKSKGLGWTYNLRDCLDFRPRVKDDASGFANTGGGSLAEVPKGGSVFADFQYYLNRVDKLSLSQSGKFIITKGIYGVNPSTPEDPPESMVTHQLNVRAYTIAPSEVFVDFRENKRYTMRDIGKLEKRIENLEYYTSLSLLEKDTADMLIPDDDGNDRFKNGFIVDNFRGHGIGNTLNSDYRCAVDMQAGLMRPMYWSDHVNLIEENTTTEQRTADHYAITGDLFTLPYEEENLINQPIASNTINVNPFNVIAFIGDITLDPPNDEWKDTERAPDLVVNQEGNFDAISQVVNGVGTIWNDWQTFWTGTSTQVTSEKVGQEVYPVPTPHPDPENLKKYQAFLDGKTKKNKAWMSNPAVDNWPHRDIYLTQTVTTVDSKQSRSGVKGTVVPKVVTEDLGDKVINVAYIPYIRTRDVKFRAVGMMPNTRLYPFFDNVDVGGYCTAWASPTVEEAFDAGDVVSTGTKLVTDATGKASGTFRIPNTDTVRFQTGQRVFKLTSRSDGSTVDADSYGTAAYRAQGLLETKQKTILSTRNAEVSWDTVVEERVITDSSLSLAVERGPWVDPIAETFLVEAKGGAFLTSVELYFAAKDTDIPVTVEIRETVNGYPGSNVLPFSRVTKDAANVTVVDDPANLAALTPTKFTFRAPVYVKQGQEYCIVCLTNSNRYKVWIATMGQNKVGTEIPIVDQPYPGSFFKSQNASTWTADQYVDLMFKLNYAQFDISDIGTATFTNDVLPTVALDSDCIVTTNGKSKIRVIHQNHGFRSDGSKQSRVTLSGAVDTNGIAAAAINTTHIILSCDFDSYVVDTGDAASLTGRGGGGNIRATENRQMDLVNPVVSHIILPDTDIKYGMKTCSSKSVHSNGSASDLYVMDSNYVSVTPNENFEFDTPRLVASAGNETQHLSGGKSFFLRANLSSSNPNISPVIDLQRLALITVGNRIDNPSFTGDNSVNDTDLESLAAIAAQPSVVFTASGKTITTTDATVGAALSQIEEGKYIGVAPHAFGTLTLASNVESNDTVVIAGKTYTFQDTLTNSNGNVKIGVDASASIDNLIAAINLGSGSGTLYAAATTLHTSVTALAGAGDTMVVYAKSGGTAGNSITTTESSSHMSWGAGTLAGGNINTTTYRVISVAYTPSDSTKITIVVDGGVTDNSPLRLTISQLGRYVDEKASKGGSASSKYITKRMVLTQASEGFRINFAAVKPPSVSLQVYYKVSRVDDPTPIDDLAWTLIDVDGTSGDSTNLNDYRDYNYTISELPDFNAMMTKIVMLGSNTCEVPKVKDFRMIALGT